MMSRDDRYDSAVIGGMEMIAGGVTTVADFTSTGASFEAAQERRFARKVLSQCWRDFEIAGRYRD